MTKPLARPNDTGIPAAIWEKLPWRERFRIRWIDRYETLMSRMPKDRKAVGVTLWALQMREWRESQEED